MASGGVADGKGQPDKDTAGAKTSSHDDGPQKTTGPGSDGQATSRDRFKNSLTRLVGVFTVILTLHILGIYLFLSGFLLTRLVLEDKSECAIPPIQLSGSYTPGSFERGCWHKKTFDKAVVIVVDALRYDFTVPFHPSVQGDTPQHYHNALPILHETTVTKPENSILLPFIADPPTTTLQRLKGLTTGTLPTFIDAGSNFAGTAIDEDNLVAQLYHANKTIVHLGDDTWQSLFPGYFDPNLTKPYDSFNVWDLFTVDNGVNEHLFPLLDKTNVSRWDVIFGHYLGVDHAGHRYGPNHPAMTSKLHEMNEVFTRLIDAINDDTLLVVMGDHGMDAKGDHGGESDDEVEAALWMYSKKNVFGRLQPSHKEPPVNAKERSVRQIDLVPTLSLLLGMPVPFNNLGKPIDEAFIGRSNSDFPNLAKVHRLTAAQIHLYQQGYAAVRKLDAASTSPLTNLWDSANRAWGATQELTYPPLAIWKTAHKAFSRYEQENLDVCRGLWARFDMVSIVHGIEVLVLSFLLLGIYARGLPDTRVEHSTNMVTRGFGGIAAGAVIGLTLGSVLVYSTINTAAYCASLGGIAGMGSVLYSVRREIQNPLPKSSWAWACTVFPLLLCIGFAANSFTIWEDEILLFFLSTFGVLMVVSSLRRDDAQDRFLGAWQSIAFVLLTLISSSSRLCREEQMPYCKSTYYSSASSSTSAKWQLSIPFIVAAILPSAIRDTYARSKNYQGSAVLWIGLAFRIGLSLSALYWTLDAADDNDWLPWVPSSMLRTTRVIIAQTVLAGAYAAGYSTYVWAQPLIGIEEQPADATDTPKAESGRLDPANSKSDVFTTIKAPEPKRPKILILGYANAHGTRFFLLPTVWMLALVLLQKPMGQGTLSLCLLSILNLLEILDANDLRSSPVGPVVLAMLGSFYYFKTGHQATLASIQWESAFIPLKSIRYPWSPLLVILSTFAPQILCVIAVPALILWKVPPRQKGLLNDISKALATHILFYAAIALATVVEAAWLRRHLMLYRIFMPRMLMAVAVMIIVEIFGIFIGLLGVRQSVLSTAEAFGWNNEL